ncbi:MAG: NapC/NirT family cytochrome c [Actinobacteria bacterium]|nr:NapC/NirT family cytochrome c [Actinomycetota bacterium]
MAERKPEKGRILLEGRVPGRWILGVLVALGVLFAAAIIGFSAVNRIDTCEVCHMIKPEVVTYKQTAHYRAGVGCQKCHTKPGVFNYLIRNLQGATNLILYASNQYEHPITTFVGSGNCAQCHPNSQIEKDLVVGNIRVNHKGLREAGYQCITCHANISHPGTRPAISRTSQNKMSICARCHDGKQLPDTCSTCHINGVPASAPKVAMNLQIDATECRGCHEKASFCSDCHNGLEMPHPERWNQVHGGIVLDRGKTICVSCHLKDDPTFCIKCHGLPMPHPGGWTSAHGTYAQDHPEKCVKCHGKNSCIDCHGLPMPHPAGWVGTHPSTASASPGLCTKCHSSSFCVACHGVELPHGSAFIADHPNHVYNSGSICMKCHGNGGTGPEGCWGGQCHTGSIN